MENKNMLERNFKGIWIPKEIWLSETLTLQEKVFLVEIDSLDNEVGCFANNTYFAKFFGLSKSRVSEVINSLEKKGFIKINIAQESGNKRTIKVLGYSGFTNRVEAKTEDPYTPKPKHNNINDNNTTSISLCTENKFSDDSFEVKAASYFYKTHEGIKTPSVLYLIKKEGFENLVYKQAAAVEKLKRIDGLSEQEIRAIILFALQDSFWQKNIRSLEKLRKKNKDNVPYYVVLVDRIKSTIETQNSNLVHKF